MQVFSLISNLNSGGFKCIKIFEFLGKDYQMLNQTNKMRSAPQNSLEVDKFWLICVSHFVDKGSVLKNHFLSF